VPIPTADWPSCAGLDRLQARKEMVASGFA
jgi:hypothetical protein